MCSRYEVDTIVKGIEISWTTWGRMRGERLVLGDISYLKSERERGFERIFSINIEDNTEECVEQMISDMKAGIIPNSMLITPNTKPSNLAEILSGKGFVTDGSAPCMMMDLDDYAVERRKPAGFEIMNVTDETSLAEWLNIVSTALFGCELVTLEQFSDVMRLNNTYLYLGLLNGKPVTACMTIIDGDTSVLDMVATLEEYRRKGLATAVIDKALTDLRARGIKTVSLRAEADGVRVYKRLGFKECFKRVIASL